MNTQEEIQNFREKENFPVASLLMPKQARNAILALYRFARSADEISDDHTISNEERKQKLQEVYDSLLQGDINKIQNNYRGFFYECSKGRMNLKHGLALLEAFIQDTEKKRYDNWDDTLSYCQKSAATIGRCVLEANGEFAADFAAADKICVVLQLINHLQDVKEDYINDNRIYFDASLIDHNDISLDNETERFTAGKNEIIKRLREILYSAEDIFFTINSFRVRAEIATIFNVADILLNKLQAKDVLQEERVELTKNEKKKALIKGIILALKIKPVSKYSSSGLAILSKSSFIKPLMKLNKDKRKAMLCFYSFCRLVDDAVDNARDRSDATVKLKQWKEEVDKIYSTDLITLPNHPISKELALYVRAYNIEKSHLLEIIEGQQMDISGDMNSPSDEVLDKYCYRVASCVGLVSIQIFGYDKNNKEKTQDFSVNLGKGLQLINIIRDVKEDAKNGRIYLPKSVMEKHLFNHSPQEIYLQYEKLRFDIVKVLEDLALKAEGYFDKALEALPQEEVGNMNPALLMMNVYKNYLDKMRSARFIFERDDIKLTAIEKLKLFL